MAAPGDRVSGVADWIAERTAIRPVWKTLFARNIPIGASWLYSLGAASLFIFSIQAATGLFLAMYYAPTPGDAYNSIQYIMYQVPFGAVVRGIHHWGASAMVVVVALHMVVAYVYGAYKYPREVTWMTGVGLLLVTLGFGFTGYLLPWDERSYWATVVGVAIPGTLPVLGDVTARILRGGADIGQLTLTRFYAFHMLLMPAALLALLGVHLFLVVYHGVTAPPSIWEKDAPQPKGLMGAKALARPDYAEGEGYQTKYTEMKHRGHAFWPFNIFEDAVTSLVVLLIIFALILFAGVPLEAQADPTNTAYVPRPDWYFLFLFQLLKYFPGNLEWVGAGIVPPLALAALLLLPLYDRNPWRSPRRRPVAMILGLLAAVAIILLTVFALNS